MGRITGRTSESQYPDGMISIKDIDMAVIVGMNDQTVGMTIWALKMIKIQKKRFYHIEFEKYI